MSDECLAGKDEYPPPQMERCAGAGLRLAIVGTVLPMILRASGRHTASGSEACHEFVASVRVKAN